VMGVINSRDRVFLVIDLPLLLDLAPISSYTREYHVMIVNVAPFLDHQSSELWLGLAVDKIQGITRSEEKPVENPNFSEENLSEYINGWIIEQNQNLMVLDLGKIVKKSF